MKKLLICFILILSLFLLSGCWDAREINTLFIVSGIAIDKSEEEGKIDVCIIGIETSPSQDPGSSPNNDGSIILKTTAKNVRDAIFKFNINNNRTIYLQHNQIVIFGDELAQENLEKHIDFFIRSKETRLETMIMIVEGRADEVFETDTKQELNISVYLYAHLIALSHRSKYFNVSLLHFISELLTEGQQPSIPIFKLNKNDCDLLINIQGLAIFRDEKMISKLDIDSMLGYLWFVSETKISNKTSITDQGLVSLDYEEMKSRKEVIFDGNTPIKIKVTIEAIVSVEELIGFESLSQQDLYQELTAIANHELISVTTETFKSIQELKADIYGIGSYIYQHHPKKWRELKYDWDNIFSSLELEVVPKARIKQLGQIISIYEQGGKK